MTEPVARRLGDVPSRSSSYGPYAQGSSANLADILERVLDKGIVIAGDIRINLLDIELLTVKLRLLVASVDKAKEMGIDWWEHDPSLSSRAHEGHRSLIEENKRLRAEIEALHQGTEVGTDEVLTDGAREISDAARRTSPGEQDRRRVEERGEP
ncbi:gas vesicle protein [Streptomyces gelaticus]|uniref:gas vesicle protein n=1 Tax=Streptomyces gelaticus TaxID=285446 RepID=UPI00167AC6CE